MFNIKTIRTISALTLLATVASIGFSNFNKLSPVEATSIPATTPIASELVQFDPGDTITAVTSAMDDNGNQIVVWAGSQLTEGGPIAVLKYQKFQSSGLPLTPQKTLRSLTITSSPVIKSPEVNMDRNGNFVVAWAETNSTASINHIRYMAVNPQGRVLGNNSFVVEDTGTGFATNAKVSVALSQEPSNGDSQFAITWLGCATTNCTSQRQEYKSQGYHVDFYDTFAPQKYSGTNYILNPAPYESAGDAPSIAFSGQSFLVTWPGYETTNTDANWAIFGRHLNDHGDPTTPTPFKLSNFSTKETDVSVVGTPRSGAINYADCIELGNCDQEVGANQQVFYIAFATNYLNSNTDIYIEKVICTTEPLELFSTQCENTARENGSAIFARANTATTGVENKPKLSIYSNKNDAAKLSGSEDNMMDYLSIVWNSYDATTNVTTLRNQNFKENLARLGTENIVATINGNAEIPGDVAMDLDGNYSIAYADLAHNQIIGKLYQSLYLRAGAEALVHAPDSTRNQGFSRTAMNADGRYVVVYETTNSSGYKDIAYSLYDKYGNPIKAGNVNSYSEATNNVQADVAFFNGPSGSPESGKFIVTWITQDSPNNKVFYQMFDEEGKKSGSAVEVASGVVDYPQVSAGQFQQFIIVYRERELLLDPDEIFFIKYFYNNNGTTIDGEASTTHSADIGKPYVALDPQASTVGDSDFAIVWTNGSQFSRREGRLQTANSVTLDATTTHSGIAYDMTAGSLSNAPGDSFVYSVMTVNVDFNARLYTFEYDADILDQFDLGQGYVNPRIAMDQQTGNLLLAWEDYNDYAQHINSEDTLYFTKDSNTALNINDRLFGQISNSYGTISDIGDFINGYYYFLREGEGGFYEGENIDVIDENLIYQAIEGSDLYFNNYVGGSFSIGDTITGSISGATATVDYVFAYGLHVSNITGEFVSGDNVGVFGDTIDSQAQATFLQIEEPNSHYIGENISDSTSGATGTISNIVGGAVSVTNVTGQFAMDDILSNTIQTVTFIPDSIGIIKNQFYRLNISGPDIENNYAVNYTKFGPEFSPNTHFNYGQYLNSPDIAFDTRSSEDDGKLAINTYSISGDNQYLDTNGVLQQLLYNPFTIGQVQDLSPVTNQDVNPGGKYIIVPQVIDFGNLGRGTTGQVKFSDLTMPDNSTPGYLQVTDLDGTDFDLTVSLTDLENTTSSGTIPNSNFVIENNDGINAEVTSSYSFTNTADVTLDPSTDIGEEANLSTTQTILRKTNNNTGVWNIHPNVKLTIPADASSGTYSGTITFTLI